MSSTERRNEILLRGLPVPTSSDALLVNGRPLTIDGFQVLRTQFPEAPKEDLLFIARAAMVLEDDAHKAGRELSIQDGVTLATYALGRIPSDQAGQALAHYGGPDSFKDPKVFRSHVDRLLSLAVVQRNPQVLAELH